MKAKIFIYNYNSLIYIVPKAYSLYYLPFWDRQLLNGVWALCTTDFASAMTICSFAINRCDPVTLLHVQ